MLFVLQKGRQNAASFHFQTTVILKECASYTPTTTCRCFLYHSMTCIHLSNQYNENHGLTTILIIRMLNVQPSHNFTSDLVISCTNKLLVFRWVPIGTNYALLIADLFLFCYERYFMTSLSDDNQADIIETLTSTS